MTRSNPLVLDGSEVKLRLEAERIESGSFVHVDWVRFTCQLRNAPAPSVDLLFPDSVSIWDDDYRKAKFQKALRDIPDADFVPSAQALDLANDICKALGPDFTVSPEVGKGHDFYRFRWSILRNGAECAWVGFLTSGDSPKQEAQGRTIHANLYGSACTFASADWNNRIANLIELHDAKLTRVDLALDFFDGGIDLENTKQEYLSGLMDSAGKRLKCNMVGDWANGSARSFYIGSKEAGKQTNIYEKGDQLFGVEANSPWVRIELRYGNKLRHLTADALRRPADFFAGASEWHSEKLAAAGALPSPESIPCQQRLPVQTIEAEVHRAIKWAIRVAGPSLGMFVKHATETQLFEVLENKKLPARMSKFSPAEITSGFSRAIKSFTCSEGLRPALAAI